jgi:hypothetical protein
MRGQMDLPAFRELPPERRAEQRARVQAAVRAPRRRRPILVVAVTLAVLAAAPAFALQRQLVDFWTAEPAPGPIQLEFDRLKELNVSHRARGLRPWPDPVGVAREVLAVTVDGERRPLWVIATEEGGFCFRFHFHASCGRVRGDGGSNMKMGVGGLSTEHGDGLAWVVGQVLAPEIEEIELIYEDGERVKVPFVWVSPPIDAGFLAYEVPEERRVPGRLTAVIIGRDSEGNEIAQQCLTRSPEALARSAILRERCERPR